MAQKVHRSCCEISIREIFGNKHDNKVCPRGKCKVWTRFSKMSTSTVQHNSKHGPTRSWPRKPGTHYRKVCVLGSQFIYLGAFQWILKFRDTRYNSASFGGRGAAYQFASPHNPWLWTIVLWTQPQIVMEWPLDGPMVEFRTFPSYYQMSY